MAVNDPPIVRPLTARGEPAANREDDEVSGAIAFIWVLFVFKMVTLVMIFWAARSYDTAVFLTATHWFWAFVPAVILAGPIVFRYRLLRVRRRREQLRRAEWLLDQPSARRPMPPLRR